MSKPADKITEDYDIIFQTDIIAFVHTRNLSIYKCFKPLDHWEVVGTVDSQGKETVTFDILHRAKHKTIGGLARKLVNGKTMIDN